MVTHPRECLDRSHIPIHSAGTKPGALCVLSRDSTELYLQELTADFPAASEGRGLLIPAGCYSLHISRKIEEASQHLVELPGKRGGVSGTPGV